MPILIIIFCAFFLNATAQTATFYHDKYEGRKTANGDIFRQNKLTCASNDYRFGTILRVTYNKKFVDIRVNDRMNDTIHGVIDLSKYAFCLIGDTIKGRLRNIKVKIIKK